MDDVFDGCDLDVMEARLVDLPTETNGEITSAELLEAGHSEKQWQAACCCRRATIAIHATTEKASVRGRSYALRSFCDACCYGEGEE